MVGGSGATWLGSVARLAVMAGTLSAVSAFAGCGDNPAPRPDLEVGLSADWFADVGPPVQAGFNYYVLVEQRANTEGTCDQLPATLQITALGQAVPVALDSSGCLSSKLAVGPFLQQPSEVVVTIEEDGKMIAQATTSALTPGASATLVSPADGIVHPGDEIIVAPTPGLPSSELFYGQIFTLEDPPPPVTELEITALTRLADGIHTRMPAFSGRAALVIQGSPTYIADPMLSCEGFAICTSIASSFLGPVILTGEM